MSHLQGEDTSKLDAKGRFILKQALREMVGDAVYTYRGPNGSVRVAAAAAWDRLYAKLELMDNHLAEVNEVQNFFISGCCRVTVEQDGRVRVAGHLMDWMGLSHESREVVVCPVVGGIELWSVEEYAKYKGRWKSEEDQPKQSRIQRLCERVLREADGTMAPARETSEPASVEA